MIGIGNAQLEADWSTAEFSGGAQAEGLGTNSGNLNSKLNGA